MVRLFEAVAQDTNQIAFYDPCVGTSSYLGRKFGRRVGILLGTAFGAGLQQNVEGAYRYMSTGRSASGYRRLAFGIGEEIGNG